MTATSNTEDMAKYLQKRLSSSSASGVYKASVNEQGMLEVTVNGLVINEELRESIIHGLKIGHRKLCAWIEPVTYDETQVPAPRKERQDIDPEAIRAMVGTGIISKEHTTVLPENQLMPASSTYLNKALNVIGDELLEPGKLNGWAPMVRGAVTLDIQDMPEQPGRVNAIIRVKPGYLRDMQSLATYLEMKEEGRSV